MLAVLRTVSPTLALVSTVLLVVAIIYVAKIHAIDNVTPTIHHTQQVISRGPTLTCTEIKAKTGGNCSQNCSNFDTDLIQQLSEATKSMHSAKIHVRGTKTADSLKNALEIMGDVLQSFDIDMHKLVSRTAVASANICPEEYKGSLYGYPMYYNGLEETSCSYGKSLRHILTVVTLIKDADAEIVSRFINSITRNSGIAIRIATDAVLEEKPWVPDTVTFLDVDYPKSDGWLWNQLVANVTTPYVLIARDAEIVTKDARLERLVREIEMLQVPVAAGAVRYPDGHWKKGCYQSVHRNFTVRYLEGYDESMHECLFCDYVIGSFVVKIETLQSVLFSDLDMHAGLIEDWFLRIKETGTETILCPDSMFHTRYANHNADWTRFMNKWGLYRFVSPQGESIYSDCSEVGKPGESLMLSPCSMNVLSEAFKIVTRACESHRLFCEIQEGTLLGAVKFDGILPWELDADIGFMAMNFTDIQKLGYYFKSQQFELLLRDMKRDTFKMSYRGFKIEMYGQYQMDSQLMALAEQLPTRVLLDGEWVRGPRNPGLAARNRYGHDMYRHALHWAITGGTSGLSAYRAGEFRACSNPAQHDCLDRYSADGNIQFTQQLP